jgi:VWFA-related protein
MKSVLAAIAALAALAQTTPQPEPRFKATTDLVRVDVNVVDGNGQPIRDLKADEFEVKVDGQPRKIASLQFVSVDTVGAVPASSAPPRPVDYSSNVEEAGGRLIMLVVDRTSIAPGRGKAAFEAASRFVGGLNRADRVALASIPEGPQIDFTSDHRLVQRKLQEVDGTALAVHGRHALGISDALSYERNDTFQIERVIERECGVVPPDPRGGVAGELKLCMDEVHSEAMLTASDARNRAQESVNGLQALLERLPPSATPKILIYISEGFVLDGERAQLSWLAPRAAAAHVTVYALHLMLSETDASRARPSTTYMTDRAAEEVGLGLMADATRGDVFRVMGNSDFAFRRLTHELSGYYLLGFEPEGMDRNGRPHGIKVEVSRRGVTVRSRQQFTISRFDVPTMQSEITAALRDPLPSTEVPIKVTTYSFQDPKSAKLRLLVAAEIDRSTNPSGAITVGYVLVDFNNKLAANLVESPKHDPAAGSTQRYFTTALVDPGKYTLKLVAVDDANRRGSVERVVSASLASAGPIKATDLLVAEAADNAANSSLAPAVSADFSGGTLHGYLELFADASEVLDMASVTLEVARTESSPALERAPVQLQTPKDDAKCRIAGASIGISSLPSGDYVARAVITLGGKTVGQVLRPFRVARTG